MKKTTVKLLIVAACFTLPFFGGELMARDHHRGGNTAVKIIDAVGRLLHGRPAHRPVYRRPAPPPPKKHVYRRPAPPPKKHIYHCPAPKAAPAHRGGHRR